MVWGKNWFIIGILLSFFLLASFAGSDDFGNDIVADSIFQALESQDKVEVVVYFKDHSQSTTKISAFEVNSKTNQEQVLDNDDEFELKHQYFALNGMSGTTTEKGIKILEANPNVDKVFKSVQVRAFLSDSVPMVNGTVVHQKQVQNENIASVNLTGLDQSVCVIDSGVDYTQSGMGGCFGAGCKVVDGWNWVDNEQDPMDDNGHGTHVASITASNDSTNKGVAPDARVIALKALDFDGSGSSTDIIAALDWCVGNRTAYNITTVVMSLGTSIPNVYSSHCDSINDDSSGLAATASNAAAQGLFIAVSTGNDYNSSDISSPACAINVTAVSSINDGSSGTTRNAISSFSNYNNITDIFAPGNRITAQVPPLANCGNNTGNGLCSESGTYDGLGTSQAAPHVAGAAMLLIQYKKLENGTNMTHKQVEDALTNTSVFVNDTENNRNIPRLDILASLEYIDEGKPLIIIDQPANTTYGSVSSLDLNITASDIFSDSTYYSLDGGTQTTFTANSTITITEGTHTLEVFANDTSNNINSTTVTFHVAESPTTLLHPATFQNVSKDELVFRCHGVSDITIDNITLYHDMTGTFGINETVATTNASVAVEFSINNSLAGTYSYNCEVTQSNNTKLFSANNLTYTIDTTDPVLYSIDLPNKVFNNFTNLTVTVNATDDSLGISNVTADGTALTLSNGFYTGTVELTNSPLDIIITDIANNILTNSTTEYTIDDQSPNITLTAPAQSAENVNRNNNITIDYSETLNETKLATGSILFLDDLNRSVDFRIYYANNQTILEPSLRLQENTVFTINITSAVTDLAENAMDSFKLTFTTIARDTDNDGTPDSSDDDDDNDNLDDTVDFLNGNVTNVDSDELSLLINFTTNSSFPFEGSTELRFFKDDEELLDFDFNFANATRLSLDNVSIKVENDTADAGGIVIQGLQGVSKTVYINNLTTFHGVCIKNQSASEISQVNGSCTGESEFFVACPGSKHGVSCASNGTKLQISGITHSAITQLNDTIAPLISEISVSTAVVNDTFHTVTLSVTTDESASCSSSTSDTTYGSMTALSTTDSTTSHSTAFDFEADGSGTYYVRCSDEYGNQMQESTSVAYSVDITEPASDDPGTPSTTPSTTPDSNDDVSADSETIDEDDDTSETDTPTIISGGADEPADTVVTNSYTFNYSAQDLEAIIEINDNLKEGLKEAFGRLGFKYVTKQSPQILEQIESDRKLEIKGNSTLSLSFTYNGSEALTNFVTYDEIPKEFSLSASDMNVAAEGAKISIIEEDPIFMFVYETLEPQTEYTISYETIGRVNSTVIEKTKSPYFLVQDDELPFIVSNEEYIEAALAIILIIIVSFVVGLRMRKRRFKPHKVKDRRRDRIKKESDEEKE